MAVVIVACSRLLVSEKQASICCRADQQSRLNCDYCDEHISISFQINFISPDVLAIYYSEGISDVKSTVTQYLWLAKSDQNKRND